MNTRIKDFPMTNITLRRTATLAATLCTALALSIPAFALDVQIQEGAAVKFPKGLKWEPMATTQIDKDHSEKQNIAWGTAKPEDRKRAIEAWGAQSQKYYTISSWSANTNDGSYFITAALEGCVSVEGLLPPGEACKAKIFFTPTQSNASATIDVGLICNYIGRTKRHLLDIYDNDLSGVEDIFDSNRPEIAFDAKSRTFYLRQIVYGKVVKQCNRKITLIPGDKTSGGAAQNAATPAPASQSQSGAGIAGDITPRRALEALYGSVSTANTPDRDCKEYASWKPPLNTEKFKNYFQDSEKYKSQPLLVCSKFSASYTEQDKQKFVLVTRAGIRDAFDTVNFSTTDVPPPIIGMAVFVKDGGQWRLEVEDRFAAYTGFSETLKLQKIGANKYGVLLTDVSHYGAGCDDVEVKLLMPHAGGVTAHELNVPLTEKEEMSFSECKATSVSFDTKSRDEHYPVTVKQTFTDERGRNIKKSARLTFSNGSYVKSK